MNNKEFFLEKENLLFTRSSRFSIISYEIEKIQGGVNINFLSEELKFFDFNLARNYGSSVNKYLTTLETGYMPGMVFFSPSGLSNCDKLLNCVILKKDYFDESDKTFWKNMYQIIIFELYKYGINKFSVSLPHFYHLELLFSLILNFEKSHEVSFDIKICCDDLLQSHFIKEIKKLQKKVIYGIEI